MKFRITRNIVIDEYISNIHLSPKYNSIHIKQSFAIEKFGLLLNYHCWHFKTSFLLKNTFAISARKGENYIHDLIT